VTRGRPQAITWRARERRPRAGFPEDRRHPDCRCGTPLRGGRQGGDLARRHARGPPTSRSSCRLRDQGCSTRHGGGELTDALTVRPREGRGYLRSCRIDPHHAHRHCLTRPRRNRRRSRGAASHAVFAMSGGLRRSTRGPACTGLCQRGRCGVARCLLALRRGRAVARRALGRVRGKRRPTQRHGRRRPQACAGEDRTLEVVLARRPFGCRSRQTEPGDEKRAPSISPDLERVRGRSPSPWLHVREYVAAGEEALALPSRRKASRDRHREGARSALGAEGWRWKALRIVVAGGSSWTAGDERSWPPRRPRHATSEAGSTGQRQGCQRYGECRERAEERTPRDNPRPPTEADPAS